MYKPTERELLLLDWAISCKLYSPGFFRFDQSFRAVWLRVFRSLDVRKQGVDLYWEALKWLSAAGRAACPTFPPGFR